MLYSNHSVLPFVKDTKYLFKNLPQNDSGRSCPVLSSPNQTPPFQFRVSNNFQPITVELINENTGNVIDVKDAMTAAGLFLKQFDGFRFIYYAANVLPTQIIPLGEYYIKMTDGADEIYFSENFKMCKNVDDFIKISFRHEETINTSKDLIFYENYFTNYIYFDSIIGKADYIFLREVETRPGYNFPTHQVSTKRYKFSVLVPEFLADMIRTIRHHDIIEIEYRGQIFPVSEFIATSSWLTEGDLAESIIEFESGTIAVVNGKAI